LYQSQGKKGFEMNFQLEHALEVLQRTPVTLNTLLRGLSASWTHANEGAETWSPYDVIGHLIHGEETDWIPRLKIILEHGESKPFEPCDRVAFFEKSKGKTLHELLDTFAAITVFPTTAAPFPIRPIAPAAR
jgi:hypothetical protein